MSILKMTTPVEVETNQAEIDLAAVDVTELNPDVTISKFNIETQQQFKKYTTALVGQKDNPMQTPDQQRGSSKRKKKRNRSSQRRQLQEMAEKEFSKREGQQDSQSIAKQAEDKELKSWKGIPDGRGLFNSDKQEEAWFKNKVRDQIPVKDPQQLIQLGTNSFKGELQDEYYTPGEGFIIHYAANYYNELPSIGYHLGAFKAMHYLAREHLDKEVDDDDKILEDVVTLKAMNLKHLAFKISGYVLPSGAESHKILTDYVNPREICDRIDAVANADEELYCCYNVIGHMLELSPEDREHPPDLFKYLYLIELYVNEIGTGKKKKESVALSMSSVYPGEPAAAFIAKIQSVADSDDESEMDEDVEGPSRIRSKTDQSGVHVAQIMQSKGTSSKEEVGKKNSADETSNKSQGSRKRSRDAKKKDLAQDSDGNSDSDGEDEDDDEDNRDQGKKVVISEPCESAKYVPMETFVKMMKHVTTQINSIAAQNREIVKNQNSMMEQIGQIQNQKDLDPESRKQRTGKLVKTLMDTKVPDTAKNVAGISAEDQRLIKILSKQTVTLSEMEDILQEIKIRLMGTSKETVAKTLTAKKLLGKMLRDRLVDTLKEAPDVAVMKLAKRNASDEGPSAEEELQKLMSTFGSEEVLEEDQPKKK